MTPISGGPPHVLTSWTLGRNEARLTCALVGARGGCYMLRLSLAGRRILDEECGEAEQGLARSLDLWQMLLVGGWVHESACN